MECQTSDSKKLYKVFDASKRKRSRKIKEGHDDSNSVVTDDTASGCQGNVCRSASAKTSLHDVPTAQTISMNKDSQKRDRDRDSSPAASPSPTDVHHKRSSTDTRRSEIRSTRSPRRNRRQDMRDEMSLALKAGLISPATSVSPRPVTALDSLGHDEDSIIYAFLEDAIKKEKKKERQSRRHDDYRPGQRHTSVTHRHRHHHHHRRRCEEALSRDRDKSIKDLSPVPAFNQAALFETFAKLCAQFNEKSSAQYEKQTVQRSHSHKSLQCEVMSKHDYHDVDQRPTRLLNRTEEQSRENVGRIRSQDNFRGRPSHDRVAVHSRPDRAEKKEKCNYCPSYDKEIDYVSKLDLTSSRMRTTEDRYQDYQQNLPDINFPEQYKTRPPQEYRDFRDYEWERRNYEEKRYVDQRTSRSFDVREHRDCYPEEEKWRRTTRSDNPKDRRYDQRYRRYEDRDKYYEDRTDRDRYNMPQRDNRRSRRISDRFERNSVASREDDYRDRDRYSEKERDSGLSVADGENSTVSGKSNYLRVMKEIVEQREAMDKMMKLWKELMRCFKGLSPQTQGQEKAVHENAANVRDSAAAQLRLWRECMRRYETVARDVGDTDARLMEEINKQRSEMAEMASMWQECLQRYREMSTDFNSLKQQLTPPEPTRLPAAPPVACAEGEGSAPAAPYRLPPNYPPQIPAMAGYGSPLRQNASVPPAWWWSSPRRRSSPDSRGSRDRERERRHRQKGGRDDTRYKDKPSKPSAARSEHRHRKR
ncbi:zinc finger CCCH domain-containing protein 13-like isoform X2 [Plodia interpunctella]|uniref:zinc finger CCCH domain-containing protein 13-like isoform X2 n=1 Tax=Plodia interpunctella TaxID=58824 RepID=UPI0023680945|nr:zinc finger CCCH domain-containing protein 13-like isoform X2 [Plodia interpunctella]